MIFSSDKRPTGPGWWWTIDKMGREKIVFVHAVKRGYNIGRWKVGLYYPGGTISLDYAISAGYLWGDQIPTPEVETTGGGNG